MKHWRNITLIAVALLLMSSCNNAVFYSDSHSIEGKTWSMFNPERYDITIEDSLQYYDFYVDLRIRDNYKYSNLFLFITTTFPDGSIAKDTLECPIADAEGKWFGKHSGTMVDYRFPLCRKVRFPNLGTYHFDIVHGMRDNDLEGVKNLGLRMEYYSSKDKS